MIKLTSSVLLLASAFAGAQTVTVGTTSSTQNGTTTTITVPVSVAVPPAAPAASTTMASFRADTGATTGGTTGQTVGASFKTIKLPNVVTDSANGWNPTSSTYAAPTTGTYLIISSVRLNDSVAANISWGQGVNTSNTDSQTFVWATTAGLRNGFTNMRIMQLSAGQSVDLFAYVDHSNAVGIASASLSIQQLQ